MTNVHVAALARLADHLVEAVAFIVAHLGEHGHEVALAAAELDHPLAVQVEAPDQVAREALVEGVELGNRLGRFMSSWYKDIVWVRPTLVVELEYANRTADGILRHAVYRRLRDDEIEDAAEP